MHFCAFLRPPPFPPIQCCRFVYFYGRTYCTDKIVCVLELRETNIEWGERGEVQYDLKTQVY
jgi:hypothetical protein